jgi:cobalt ECF transporter T component CbiQ
VTKPAVAATTRRGATPDWLLRSEPGLCPCGCIGRRRKGNFVEKTLRGTTGVVRQALFADDVAGERGLLQALDVRVKVVTIGGLLVATALLRTVPMLIVMYAATLVLAAASRLSVWFFVKRVWLFVPVFTAIVVLPATLNVVTPGTVVVPLGTWFGHSLGITSEGLHGAAIIVIRVATSISLAVLLTLTTPWNRLLGGLRALFVPKMFVLVLGMAYRYLFQLLGAVEDMYTARRARTVADSGGAGRRFVTATAGALFGKTHALSEEVYLAMVSRGYTGETRLLRPPRFRPVDAAWAVGCAFASVIVIGADRVIG